VGGAGASAADADRSDTAPAAIVGRLDARGTTVVMAFSNDEALHDELERDGFLAGVAALLNVRLETLPGRDHTLRPIVAQRAVHDLLDRALLADLGRLGVRSDTGAA
jgi:hypothetical protein